MRLERTRMAFMVASIFGWHTEITVEAKLIHQREGVTITAIAFTAMP